MKMTNMLQNGKNHGIFNLEILYHGTQSHKCIGICGFFYFLERRIMKKNDDVKAEQPVQDDINTCQLLNGSEESVDDILERLNGYINTYQIIRKRFPLGLIEGKYTESWNKLKKQINSTFLKYLIRNMEKKLPVNRTTEESKQEYIMFLNGLVKERNKEFCQIAKFMPEKERKQRLAEIRLEIMKAEKEYCASVWKKAQEKKYAGESGDNAPDAMCIEKTG